ncbi:hypothetical protein [Vulgatibacter sp.]|uniref:hypothetical protein n=1 Tax=Vulgatibacter sp. TaxID=1971226 RepID=UPI003565DC0F
MAAKVGSLLIDIHANVGKIQADMAKVQGTMNGALNKMSGMLKGFAGAAAAYFGTKAIMGFVDSAIDGADALGKMATRTGASVEALSALQHAANLSDASIDDVGRGLGMLSQKMVDAINGSTEAARGFQQLGIEFKNADGSMRNSDEVLMDLADRFKGMPDGAAKAGLAMKLFGEAGTKLIPMLNNGRDGLDALKKEAEDLGLVIGNDTARRSEAFNDNMSRLSDVLKGVANTIIEVALPYLLEITDWLVDAAKKGGGFKDSIQAGFKIVATAVQVVAGVFELLGKRIGAVAASIVEVFSGNFRQAWEIQKESAKESFAIVAERAEAIGDIWTKSPEPVVEAAGKTKRAVQTIPPVLAKAGEAAKKMAEAIAGSLQRTAALQASLTKSQTDDIEAQYAAQVDALKAKMANEKTAEAERAAYKDELTALEAKRDADLLEAQLNEQRAAERRKIDVELETKAMRAELTKSELDDLEAKHEQQIEALRRRLEEEQITKAEFDEQEKLLEQQKTQAITAAVQAETEKRTAAQTQAMQQLAMQFSNVWADLAFAPLEDGLGSVEDILQNLGKMVIDLGKQLVVAGIFKLITGGATGGIGGGLLSLLGFSEGGEVVGPGTETSDSIVARLSKKEFVIKASSAKRLGLPMLHYLNSLGDRPGARLPGFARGGLVGGGDLSASQIHGAAGAVTVSPTVVLNSNGGLLHRELLAREMGPALRQMAIEQVDSIIRQLNLKPAAVSARG